MEALTTSKMDQILKFKLINTCTLNEKKQVFAYAFGDEFMASDDKGELKEITE